jgi:hypothetical protein
VDPEQVGGSREAMSEFRSSKGGGWNRAADARFGAAQRRSMAERCGARATLVSYSTCAYCAAQWCSARTSWSNMVVVAFRRWGV